MSTHKEQWRCILVHRATGPGGSRLPLSRRHYIHCFALQVPSSCSCTVSATSFFCSYVLEVEKDALAMLEGCETHTWKKVNSPITILRTPCSFKRE